LRDAERLRAQIAVQIRLAAKLPSERRRVELAVALVGGGLTGVELAAELAEALPALYARNGLDPALARIFLLEARPRLLPEIDGTSARLARRWLERHGVRVVVGTA